MERVVRGVQFLKKLERSPGPVASVFDGLGAIVPRSHHRRATEWIRTSSPKCVPINNGKPQMLLHGLAGNHFIRVVPAERERIIAIRTFVTNLGYFGKRSHECCLAPVEEL